MNPTSRKTPRSQRTLEYYFAEIMEAVIPVFLTCVPELDRRRFMSEFYGPIQASRVSGDSVLRIFHERGGGRLGKGDMALLACIYCLESGWARIDGHDELSWSFLMEAQHYVITAAAEDHSEPQLAKVLDIVRTEAKSNAARANVSRSVYVWWDAQKEAIRLVEERIRMGKKLNSIEDAAKDILPELREFLKTRNSKKRKNFTSANPEKTVVGWLQDAPSIRALLGE